MALLSRYRTATGAGTLAAAILVLAFGNPAYVAWAQNDANTNPKDAGGWFLRLLAWPAWRFDSNESVREMFAADVKALLLIIFTTLFLYLLPGSQLARARGTLSQFFAGWAAYIFAGALAGLLSALIVSNPTLLAAFNAAGAGAIYGLFVGWIVGIAALGGWRGTD